MNRFPVALFPSSAKAEPIKQQLRSSGFAAEAHEEGWLCAFWFVNKHKCGVHLDVPADQFERAERFLLEWDAKEHALNEAIRCPECGSLHILYPQFARHSILTNLAIGVAAQFGIVEKQFYCEDCHFTWPRQGTRPSRNRPHQAPYYFIEGIEQTRQPEARRYS
jgi:hypothetical protein